MLAFNLFGKETQHETLSTLILQTQSKPDLEKAAVMNTACKLRAVERGQEGTEYRGPSFFRGSALLSNAKWLWWSCFCVGVGI